MGYNTTVVVLNDALNEIENDTEFGLKLARAIRHASLGRSATREGLDVRSGGHGNAATVVESHHADGTAIVAVGGNHATVLGYTWGSHHTDQNKETIIQHLAKELGYTLKKRTTS